MPGSSRFAGARVRAARLRSLGLLIGLSAAACHSSDSDPRVTCADLADRRVGRPEAWDSLLMRQEPPVRAVAARAAGQTRDLRLAGVVGRALDVEEKDDVRAEQLFALGQIADPSPEVRGATLLALVRIAGRRNAAREPLDAEAQSGLLRGATALLDDPDAGVRWKAAYALAEIDVPGRAAALRHAANATELETRFFGVGGLVRLAEAKESTAADFLPKLKDPSPHVAALAASGLGRVGESDAIPPLVAAVGDVGPTSHWHVQRAAVAALAQIVTRLGDHLDPAKRQEALAACRKAAENPDLSVATEGMKSMIALSPDPNVDVLRDFEPIWGTSHSSFVRVALVHALAGGKYEQVGPRLVQLAGDANVQVASESLDALTTFTKGARDDARLQQLAVVARTGAASSDPAVAASALQLLQNCGTKEDLALVADVCARFVGDESAEARVDAVRVAAALAGKEAQAMLRTARSDPSPSVAAAANEEWKRLGFPDEPPPPSRASGPPGTESDGGARPSSIVLEPGVDCLSLKPNPRVKLHFRPGDVVIELLREQAPRHVKMLLERARNGQLDGLPIHRVVTGFVVQGFDPRGDGWGTGGVFLRDEINREPFLRGTVGMPNAGPDSGGCQLFVSVVPTPHLDGRYTVFGRVVSGMDVVDALDVSNVCTKAEVIQ